MAVVDEPEPEPEPTKRRRRRRYRPNGPMLAVAGLAAAGAGALYYFSTVERETWDNAETPMDEVEDARLAHNRMLAGAWGSGGLAVGLGLGAFIVGAF